MLSKSILSKIVTSLDTPLSEGLKSLDEGGVQILLITDEDNKIAGILTDGDVRRALLQNVSLDVPVSKIMNTEFSTLSKDEAHLAQDLVKNNRFNHVPILDERNHVVDLFVSSSIGKQSGIDIPVVIMAGGQGTRLSPLTRIIPKPLMPVGEQTMLEKIMHNFFKQGFHDFRVIVNYKKELIKSYCADSKLPYSISFFDEEKFLGTAGGLSLLKDTINSPFILTNCDVLAELPYTGLIDWHQEHEADLTILGVRKRIDIPYGVIKVNFDSFITSIEEKPFYNHVIVSGIYVIEPTVLYNIEQNTFQDMDELVRRMIEQNMRVTCYPIEDGWFDMGQFAEYKNLLKHFGMFDV